MLRNGRFCNTERDNSYLARTADQKGQPDEREIFNVCGI